MKSFSIIKILKILSLVGRKGYLTYFYSNRQFSVVHQRNLYKKTRDISFNIRWDMFYLNLTSSYLKSILGSELRFLTYLFTYIYFVKDIIFNRDIYEITVPEGCTAAEIVLGEAHFQRPPDMQIPRISVTLSSKSMNRRFIHLLGGLGSFENLFGERVKFYSEKFSCPEALREVYIYEGRSLFYRSLYSWAQNKKLSVTFYTNQGRSFLIDERSNEWSLASDYPRACTLKIPKSVGNRFFDGRALDLPLYKRVLVLYPTTNSASENFCWFQHVRRLLASDAFSLAIHPDTNERRLGVFSIESRKPVPIDDYDIVIGFISTLLSDVDLRQNKNLFSFVFTPKQLAFANASLSGAMIAAFFEDKR